MIVQYLTKVFEIIPLMPMGIALICCLFFLIAYVRGRTELKEKVPFPWEKKERREAKRKAKAEAKARRDFWNNKHPQRS